MDCLFVSLAVQHSGGCFLPVAGYGFLSQAMASCRRLWLPVAGYGFLSQAMASCRRLWLPVAGYGFLSQAMASCRRLWLPVADYGLLVHEDSWSHTTTRHSRQDSSVRVISSSQRPLPDNTQHTQQTNIHAPGGIQIHDSSRRAAVDLRLRLRPLGPANRVYYTKLEAWIYFSSIVILVATKIVILFLIFEYTIYSTNKYH
jgi:ribosomal protein L28